jgi:acetylornithine deacetylase
MQQLFQTEVLKKDAITLLQDLIKIPSFSSEEDLTAELIIKSLNEKGIATNRKGNNIWARNKYYDPSKPTILLNSHHDTVKPNPGYSRDPFEPSIEGDKLFGLGSNDAGASLVALMAVFLHFYKHDAMKHNLVFGASAEEESSGDNGIELLLKEIGPVDFAIVGEPTRMEMAVAEKGLLVIDCKSKGRAGHAAREEGENALYKAIDDINWFRNYKFEKVSDLLGPVKMSVTIINAGEQHNVVPEVCDFTVDIRVNEFYSFEEILGVIKENIKSQVVPRSLRMRSSSISLQHELIKAGIEFGLKYYGSPTTSDKAMMPFPSLKMGPGDSARSHMADEFVYISEITEGIDIYIKLLSGVIV